MTVLATELPLIDPNMPLETTATLAGPPGVTAGDRHRQVHEELAEARPGDEQAEEDEVEDEGGDDAERDAVDPLRAQIHVIDDPRDGVAPVGEEGQPRDLQEVGAEIAVDEDQEGDERQRRADASARPLQDEEDGRRPDEQIGLGRASRPQADVVEFQEQIDGDQRGDQREEDVEIGDVVLVVPDGPAAEKRPDVVDPLEHEERQDAEKDPQQKDPPEDEHGVQVLEPGQEMEIGEFEVEGIGQPQDHRREDGEIEVYGQSDPKEIHAA